MLKMREVQIFRERLEPTGGIFDSSKDRFSVSLRRAPSFVICLWRNDLLRYRVFTRFLFQLNVGLSARERETETGWRKLTHRKIL